LFGFLMAMACGVWFRNYRQEMQARIEELQRVQKLEREVLKAGERERERIGQDLHDGVCQTLAALDCSIECLKLDLETDGSPHIDLAREIQQQLSAATLETRNVAYGIFPVTLTADSLPAAVQSLVDTTNRFSRGIVSAQINDEISLKDREIALHLYRITQEALSNAVRHSNATRIEVDLRRNNDELWLTVTDNGCGFATTKPAEGMGSKTMRYRSNLMGAHLTVRSVPSHGTTVCCKMPLHQTPVPLAN
jgi:signal transduction histidine kinase